MSDVTVYSTEPCSFCARVKALLRSHGVEFSEINLSKDPDGRMELVSKTGMMTFPQVLVGDRLIGGFTEVRTAAESGRLDELLAGSDGSSGSGTDSERIAGSMPSGLQMPPDSAA